LFGFIIVLSAGAFAQVREVPKAILVDVIGPNGQSNLNRVRTVSTGVSSSPGRDIAPAYSVERTTFQLMNAERAANGLEPLAWNETLAEVARVHSQSMAANSYFSHRGIDGSMVDDRAAEFGVTNWLAIGENIAYMRGYDKPEAMAVEKWMNSPSHRRNVLSGHWKESAIGVALKSDGTYYFTQVFVQKR
jgi:uncharacterized protein YkwD